MAIQSDIIIVGGGLAGLTAAIHLSGAGFKVTVIEKNRYPKHKVCGEYISNEVLPYFSHLGINLEQLNPVEITHTQISTVSGRSVSSTLPLGGFGISRYVLDDYMSKKAVASGCRLVHDSVTDVTFGDPAFLVTTLLNEPFAATVVLGAFGKRSAIDQKLRRKFFEQKSPWLAVKAHYRGNYPDHLVGLHSFRGGYCGVSKVEGDAINICYLANYDTFKKYKNIEEYQHQIVQQNPELDNIFSNCEASFKPISISQLSFAEKQPVENHVLMIGDASGLIHPLCGNGMAMAIHGAKMASELAIGFLKGTIKSRREMEKTYAREWKKTFKRRILAGRILSRLMQSEAISSVIMRSLISFPSLLPMIIRQTHGKLTFDSQ